MNINAGISSYNLNLKKNKEEKRPTFATIFDKLDARSKKLNSKNPLNAVLTNEQQYRYYLEETEPMLHNNDDTFDLDDVVGNRSLKDMKLSEFAKLLSGNLENDVSNRYETLQAIVSSNASAPLVPSSITISSTPAPAPVVPPPATPATPAPPPSGSSGTGTAPAPPPSGSSGTGTAPSAAPSAAAPPPSGGGGGSGTAPAAAPAAAPSAAPAGSGLSVAIPPAGSGGGSTPTGSTAGGVISGIASAASGLLSSAKSLLSSPKPPTGGPSGTSVPTSAVASAATTAPATGVPTATPVTGAATPAGGGSGTGTAAGGVSPSAVASSLASGDEGNYNIWFGGTITGTNQLTYNNALKAGLSPPKVPDDITTTFSSTNLKWVNHIKAMNDYNEKLQTENKDPTGEYSFTFTGTQENLIKALKANGNDAQVVFEGIKDKSINLKDYETPKPPKPPAGGGGAKSGKGGKKKK
jgi:hypothetical protein